MNEVSEQLAKIDCFNLLLPILRRRSSQDIHEKPRSLRQEFYFVHGHHKSSGLEIVKYCRREDLWKETKTFDLVIGEFAAIHFDGRLIIMGRMGVGGSATNVVRILHNFPHFETNDISVLNVSQFHFR